MKRVRRLHLLTMALAAALFFAYTPITANAGSITGQGGIVGDDNPVIRCLWAGMQTRQVRRHQRSRMCRQSRIHRRYLQNRSSSTTMACRWTEARDREKGLILVMEMCRWQRLQPRLREVFFPGGDISLELLPALW